MFGNVCSLDNNTKFDMSQRSCHSFPPPLSWFTEAVLTFNSPRSLTFYNYTLGTCADHSDRPFTKVQPQQSHSMPRDSLKYYFVVCSVPNSMNWTTIAAETDWCWLQMILNDTDDHKRSVDK